MNSKHIIDHRHAPNQNWTVICHPDDPHKTIVSEDGSLLYYRIGGYPGVFFRIFYPGIDSRKGPLNIVQQTESAEVACVETRIEYEQAWLTLRTFGAVDKEGRRTDVILWQIEAKPGVRDFRARFQFTAETLGESFALSTDGHRLLVTSSEEREKFSWERQTNVQEGTTILGGDGAQGVQEGQAVALFFPVKMVHRNLARGGLVPWDFMTEGKLIQGGETISGACLLPQGHTVTDEFSYEWALQALDRERAFWRNWAREHVVIKIPDPAVQDMIVACARNIYQAREIKNGLPEFQVGPTMYRGLWIVDGYFMLEAAYFLGCGQDAKTGWEALLRRVKPNGAIVQLESHQKETGIAISTFVRQTELSDDWEKLRSIWPILHNALGYIHSLRAKAAAASPDSPEFRLMPPCFTDGGLAGERAEMTTALWTLAGLKEGQKAAEKLGFTEEAVSFQTEYDSLLADFRRVAKKYRRELPDGTPYIPMCLPGSGDHHSIPQYAGEAPPWEKVNFATATWAYAQAIYPGLVLEENDPLVSEFTHMLDLIDDEQGIPVGTGWMKCQSLWPYSSSFYAHVWLYAGNPAKAVEYLYAFANHSSTTRVWREEQPLDSFDSSDWWGDMPHNWASAEFIRLVRNLLIFERGDDLDILYGLPPEWFPTDTSPLLLPQSPTRFGPVSLSLCREGGKAIIRVACASDWSVKPKQVRLRVPGTADQVVMNGKKLRVPGDRILVLPPQAEIRVTLPHPESNR